MHTVKIAVHCTEDRCTANAMTLTTSKQKITVGASLGGDPCAIL